jgi:hypothetical protein
MGGDSLSKYDPSRVRCEMSGLQTAFELHDGSFPAGETQLMLFLLLSEEEASVVSGMG